MPEQLHTTPCGTGYLPDDMGYLRSHRILGGIVCHVLWFGGERYTLTGHSMHLNFLGRGGEAAPWNDLQKKS